MSKDRDSGPRPPFPQKIRGWWPLRGPIYPTAPFSEIGHFRSLFSEASINPTASNFDFIESSWSLLPSRFYGMSKFKKLWILWPFENGRFWARNVSPFSSSPFSSSHSSCYSVPPIFFGLPMVWGFPNLAHSFLGIFPRGVFWKIPKFRIPPPLWVLLKTPGPNLKIFNNWPTDLKFDIKVYGGVLKNILV